MAEVPTFQLNQLADKDFIEVKEHYENIFSCPPEFYVKCPGRINIIGEHVDYSGYSVLPMAIEKHMIMAVGVNNEKKFNIHNVDVTNYKPHQILEENFNINNECPHWYDYVLCGYKGVTDKYKLKNKFLNLVVKGTIPPSAGLSSSSALVCAAALATSYANKILLEKSRMATLCAHAEKYIGTQGGGMDQAIIFHGQKDYARIIHFQPLRTENMKLPKDLSFIVAHSGVRMNKAATCDFNKRVAECFLAAKLLAKYLDLNWKAIGKLSDVPYHLNLSTTEMIGIVKHHLADKVFTRTEVCQALNIKNKDMVDLLRRFESPYSIEFDNFKVGRRALHVYTEAENVKSFIRCCKNNDYKKIGELLQSSHTSLKENFECSHEKLDKLVALAQNNGAIGARLTGAGWGGCIIAAVKKPDKEKLLSALLKFSKVNEIPTETVFLTEPSQGAAIYK